MLSLSQRRTVLSFLIVVIVNIFGLVATVVFKHIRSFDRRMVDLSLNELFVGNDSGLLLTVEDTAQYGLYEPQASFEWLSTTPSNNGFVRVGEGHRYMLTAFGHQIHCVRVLRMAIIYPLHPDASPFHLSHCLSYLRMYALCNADLTLERHDPLLRNFTTEPRGAVHVCRDWRTIYDEIHGNREVWIMDLVSGKYQRPKATKGVQN